MTQNNTRSSLPALLPFIAAFAIVTASASQARAATLYSARFASAQAAVDAAAAGDTVNLDARAFFEVVRVGKPLTLQKDPAAASASAAQLLGVDLSGYHGTGPVTIRDVTLFGAGAAMVRGPTSIVGSALPVVTLERVVIDARYATTAAISGLMALRVRTVDVRNGPAGVVVSGGLDAVYLDVAGVAGNGVRVMTSSTVPGGFVNRVSSSLIADTGDSGIEIHGSQGPAFVITATTVARATVAAIRLERADGTKVARCVLQDTHVRGDELADGMLADGLVVEASTDVALSDSVVRRNARAGVAVFGFVLARPAFSEAASATVMTTTNADNAIALDEEGTDAQIEDLGGNLCTVGGTPTTCHAQSASLAPPVAPLPPSF